MLQPRQLGPFRIVRILGRGGMGSVYEGEHVDSGERAAVKVLLAPIEEDEELRRRFEIEIETLKRLRHPNIVRLFGFGEEQDLLYYVMELVEGNSLQQELRRKRAYRWDEVCKIGLEMSLDLKHAHDRGIVHRDIKPANIMLERKGGSKLSDYGIAQIFGGSRLTNINSVVGTLEYMAPEQSLGMPITPKSDLYALGAVLYALLVGKPPYQAKTLPEIVKQHQSGPPAGIQAIRYDVPEVFESVIFELLRIKPEERPTNAYLVSRRLQSILHAYVGNPNLILVKPSDETSPESESPSRKIPPSESPVESPAESPFEPTKPSIKKGISAIEEVALLAKESHFGNTVTHSTEKSVLEDGEFFVQPDLLSPEARNDQVLGIEDPVSAKEGTSFFPPFPSSAKPLSPFPHDLNSWSEAATLFQPESSVSGAREPGTPGSWGAEAYDFRIGESAFREGGGGESEHPESQEPPIPTDSVKTGRPVDVATGKEPASIDAPVDALRKKTSQTSSRKSSRKHLQGLASGRKKDWMREEEHRKAFLENSRKTDRGGSTNIASDKALLSDGLSPEKTVASEVGEAKSSFPEPTARTSRTNRFVVVREEELGDFSIEDSVERPALISPQTILASVCLILLAVFFWFMLQPVTADTLYDRIIAEVNRDSDENQSAGLFRARKKIEDFLTLYPNDPRQEKIKQYDEDLKLSRLQRDFERLVNQMADTSGLQPVERAYVEALNLSRSQPEQSVEKFQAIIDLFGYDSKPSRIQFEEGKGTGKSLREQLRTGSRNDLCVELARRRLETIRSNLKISFQDQRDLLQKRLNNAAELEPTDPEKAKAIRKAIVELYQGRPWAEDFVETAREQLREETE